MEVIINKASIFILLIEFVYCCFVVQIYYYKSKLLLLVLEKNVVLGSLEEVWIYKTLPLLNTQRRHKGKN